MIELRHIRKQYEAATPIEDLSTVINDGEVVSIIGPSGTGKSTLLRMINMLERPTSGQIIIDGEDITAPKYPLHKLREEVCMVFQSFNLFNHMTVIENVTFAPMLLKNEDPKKAYEKGMELLGKVGLSRTAFQYPDQLSGGQKQRVAIARTLAMDPKVILFDEPTSALDPTMVGEVEKVIKDLCGNGYTMLIVTHDMRFAENVASRTLFLCEGGVYEDGTPAQIFHNPQKQKTIEFINQSKEFECVITDEDGDSQFPEFYTKLDQFTFGNGLGKKTKERVQALFEEIVFQILIPEFKRLETEGIRNGKYEIKFHVSYSTRGNGTIVEIETEDIKIEVDKNYAIAQKLVEFSSEKYEFVSPGNGNKKMIITVKGEDK